MYDNDRRIVMTLDAGGTNFVFSAIQGNHEIVKPITLPACSHDLEMCLSILVEGFRQVHTHLPIKPVAISFAFPGPADYRNGVIGCLPNFPSFRGGVALGPFLEEKFGLPVFINNDGNLFAYGEALAGLLPTVNRQLEEAGSRRRYKNLIGITLGTGFGAGVVIDNILLTGDNGAGGDIWNFRNKKYPHLIVEESVSIRAVKRVYHELSTEYVEDLTPKDIFDIAEGTREGNRNAALASFCELGEMAGHAIAGMVTVVDGLVVIGGGLTGAGKYILPSLLKELRSTISTFNGDDFPALQMEVFDLTDPVELTDFLQEESVYATIPFTDKKVPYQSGKRIGMAFSSLGTSKAVSLGAYAFALAQLDNR